MSNFTIKDCIKIAKEREGSCLEKKYINCHTKMKWACKENHIWLARFSDIKGGSWCKKCCDQKYRHSYEEIKKILKKRKIKQRIYKKQTY